MNAKINFPALTPDELATYGWQLDVAGFGVDGQKTLKGASVLVSRVGGLGGIVAYELAAAGIGRLILAHAGNVKPSDLNRQLLMTHAALGQSRVECAARRLRELNPRLEVVAIPENVSDANAEALVAQADVVVDCAPLFEERFALNRACVRQRKPMVEAAVHDLEAQLTVFVPGQTPCLRCICPEVPKEWTRRFPVFGAVPASVGGMAALEVFKLLAGFGQPLTGRMLTFDLRDHTFRLVNLRRNPECPECGTPK